MEYYAGVEKSGRNAEGDSWWETWREVLHQDEWRLISLFQECFAFFRLVDTTCFYLDHTNCLQ